MERLVRWFVERHLVVNIIVVVIVVLGVRSLTSAPRETFPNITMPVLFVGAALPGAAAQDIETKLTLPIEEAIEGLDGVKDFTSVITDNATQTEIHFPEDVTDERIREAEQELRALIDAITDFPPEMEDEPYVNRVNSKRFPVVQIALAGPAHAVVETAERLERELRRLDPVSRISTIGLEDPEMRILIDPLRARAHHITILDVVHAIGQNNISNTGGVLETPSERRQVVLWNRIDDPSTVGDTVLRYLPDGGALHVSDIARIESAREDRGLIVHTNGQPGIALWVIKRDGADVLDAVDEIRAFLDDFAMPAGVSATLLDDDSHWTRNRIDLITTNGFVGGIIIAIVLFAFLSRRVALWVLIGVPVVFLGTFALFPIFDLTINVITLTGCVVVLGMLVDDAVVVAERITSLRQEGMSRNEAAVKGAMEMVRPVMASAVTTILAFMPMWSIGGMAGKMLRTLPTVVILALVISLFETFFLLPGHMTMATKAPPARRAFVLRLEAIYRRHLATLLHHRGLVVFSFIAILIIAFAVVGPRTRVMIFPQDDSQSLFVKVLLPPGTPIERTEAVAAAIERQIPDLVGADLLAVTARIGHSVADAGFERDTGASTNEAVVRAIFDATRKRSTSSAEWAAIFRENIIVPPEADILYTAEVLGPPMGYPVEIYVESNDNLTRRQATAEVADWLANIDGISNIDVDERPGIAQIDLNLDAERTALRGLTAQDVGHTLQAAFYGIPASEHRELDATTRFLVTLEPAYRDSLDSLLELPVRSNTGELVQLRDVVNPVEMPALSRIYHRNGVRATTVTASFVPDSGHTALAMAQRMDRELLPRFAKRVGINVRLGGEAVESRKTGGDIGMAALISIAGITVTIALMLGSFLEAFLLIPIIPFAVAMVLVVFFLHDQPLSLFAMTGTIGLSGVVVNSAIVMVDAIHRRTNGRELFGQEREDVIIEAASGRLRPVLVTSITTLGGVIPMAYGIGGYDAVVAPISLALGWGLALTTAASLALVPVFYTIAGDLRAFASRFRNR
ncbi:MAG: efflux RND transporter permease subunit [Deltaproteobacteria bacterium]